MCIIYLVEAERDIIRFAFSERKSRWYSAESCDRSTTDAPNEERSPEPLKSKEVENRNIVEHLIKILLLTATRKNAQKLKDLNS